MDNFPSLYTIEVQKSSSDTSGEGEWEADILGPNREYLLAPTSELRDFGKVKLGKLTREGRERLKALRPSNRREVILEQNPDTPVISTAMKQRQFDAPA